MTLRTDELQVYENYRKWAFSIHTSFKFTTFVARKNLGPLTCWVHPDDAKNADQFRIVAGGIYRALYEGRLVHQFDHAQKRYVTGEGRRAEWAPLGWTEKHLHSRVYVCADEELEVEGEDEE